MRHSKAFIQEGLAPKHITDMKEFWENIGRLNRKNGSKWVNKITLHVM